MVGRGVDGRRSSGVAGVQELQNGAGGRFLLKIQP
jgi:hypothetical protein